MIWRFFFFSVGHVGNFIFLLYLWDLLQFMAIIALESSRKSHGAFCESWMLSQGLAQMGINSGSRNPDEQFRYVGEISCTAKGFTEECACKWRKEMCLTVVTVPPLCPVQWRMFVPRAHTRGPPPPGVLGPCTVPFVLSWPQSPSSGGTPNSNSA